MTLDTRIPMAGRPTNFLADYVGGQQARQGLERNALAMQMQRTENAEAAARRIAQGVLGSQDKARAYEAGLSQASAMGMDVSAFPQQYDENAEMMLRMVAAPAEERSQFERIIQGIEDPAERQRALRVHLGLDVDANTSARLAQGGSGEPKRYRVGNDLVDGAGNLIYQGKPSKGQTINVNTGSDGINYGNPPKDMAWQRDQSGNVVLDDRGAPIPIPLSNTEAFQNAQQSVTNSEEILSTVDRFLSHPGFNRVYGLAGQVPNRPGSEAAGAQSILDQLQGKAFLAAFETLKGGGQITEAEGKKATAAITRALDPNLSPDEARTAWGEFRDVVNNGLERSRQSLSRQGQPQATPQAAPQGAPSVRDMTDEELKRALGL